LPPLQHAPPAAHIEEVTETNILQVTQITQVLEQDQCEDNGLDIFQVFAAKRKKRDGKAAQLADLTEAPPPDKPPAFLDPQAPRSTAQYRYHSNAEDQQLISELYSWLMEGKLSLATPAHILAASPTIHKELAEKLKVCRVETNLYERSSDAAKEHDAALPFTPLPFAANPEPVHSLPLLEIEVLVGDLSTEHGILNPGSQIVVIRRDLAKEVGAHINTWHHIKMEAANGGTNWTVGCAKYLTMQVGGVPFKIHAHVVEDAPFKLLLRRPFGRAVSSIIEDLPNGEVEVSVRDPTNPTHRVYVPAQPRKGRVASVKVVSVITDTDSFIDSFPLSSRKSRSTNSTAQHRISSPPHPLPPLPPPNTTALMLMYKKVANKVRPVAATLPEDFRNIC
jgi:hypothetical protein